MLLKTFCQKITRNLQCAELNWIRKLKFSVGGRQQANLDFLIHQNLSTNVQVLILHGDAWLSFYCLFVSMIKQQKFHLEVFVLFKCQWKTLFTYLCRIIRELRLKHANVFSVMFQNKASWSVDPEVGCFDVIEKFSCFS